MESFWKIIKSFQYKTVDIVVNFRSWRTFLKLPRKKFTFSCLEWISLLLHEEIRFHSWRNFIDLFLFLQFVNFVAHISLTINCQRKLQIRNYTNICKLAKIAELAKGRCSTSSRPIVYLVRKLFQSRTSIFLSKF